MEGQEGDPPGGRKRKRSGRRCDDTYSFKCDECAGQNIQKGRYTERRSFARHMRVHHNWTQNQCDTDIPFSAPQRIDITPVAATHEVDMDVRQGANPDGQNQAQITQEELNSVFQDNEHIKSFVTIKPDYVITADANNIFSSLTVCLAAESVKEAMSNKTNSVWRSIHDEDTDKPSHYKLRQACINFGMSENSESLAKRKDEYPGGSEQWDEDLLRSRQWGSWVSADAFFHITAVLFKVDICVVKPPGEPDKMPYTWYSQR